MTQAARDFERFHAANPHVYALLVQLSRQYLTETGHTTAGFSLIYGAARWKWAIETSGDVYKLDNDYAPFYARMIMGLNPDLGQLFELRRSVADDWAFGNLYPVAPSYVVYDESDLELAA